MEIEVIVIGAGISGLATAKCMKDAGFNVQLLERTGHVGGLWKYKERNYGVMTFTHINVSKHNYCFSDFPISDHHPDYLHHTDLAQYIVEYTKHFELDNQIRFHRQVVSISQRDDRKWEISAEFVEEDESGHITPTGKKEIYVCKYLAIATGHHCKPAHPSFPGLDTFSGDITHSIEYKDADYNNAAGKKVVVVGIGNSAIDVACNAATIGRCKPVYVSTRSGAWIVPNYIFGSPTDHFACRLFLSLPWQIGSFIFETVVSLIHGNPRKWGLNPKMHILQTQPTVSATLINHIQRGEIKIVPNIKKIDGSLITFEDGSSTEAQKLILCTGYSVDLPFLDKNIKDGIIDENGNLVKLYKNVFKPDIGHTLAFIGFVQPASGGVLTMSETQGRWWAELCRNNVILPMKVDMERSIEHDLKYVKQRWFSSKRHGLQKDPLVYNDEIASFFGAKPEFRNFPLLSWRLLLGSCGAAQWRLQGPGKWNKAEECVRKVPVTPLFIYSSLFLFLFFTVICCYFIYCLY